MQTQFLPALWTAAALTAVAVATAEAKPWPDGWSPFPADSRPPVTFRDAGKVIEVTSSTQKGTRSLSLALPGAAGRICIEFAFAFSAGKGRALNLWTREPDGEDANLVNLAINNGVLQQYTRPDGWQNVTAQLKPTTDWTSPVWHIMRVVADAKAPGVTYYVSAPGAARLPAEPTATRRGYRPGMPFGSVNLAYGRLAPGARFLVRNLVIKQGEHLPAPHPLPREERFVLWDRTRKVPKSADLAPLEGVRFSVIQRREPAVDDYNWLHGVAAVWHGRALWTSFGRNKGDENTVTEIAQGRTSPDAGRTWGPVFHIDGGTPGRAVSHGVFLSHKSALWAFHGHFTGKLKDVHTVAYLLDPAAGRWLRKATVAAEGYWPTAEPQRMADGNWIMAGFCVAGRNPAAVAVSEGDNFTRWRLVKIPLTPRVGRIWGESAVIVRGKTVLCIARWAKPVALAAASNDCGRTWSTMIPTNLPMAASKPYAGVLSTGQQYLICTTTADAGNRRSPLTIAVGRPGQKLFSKVFRIRDAVADAPGESTPKARLSYPYAVEHEGCLYVVYSNDGGRGHNRNSAEMAVIPLRALAVRE